MWFLLSRVLVLDGSVSVHVEYRRMECVTRMMAMATTSVYSAPHTNTNTYFPIIIFHFLWSLFGGCSFTFTVCPLTTNGTCVHVHARVRLCVHIFGNAFEWFLVSFRVAHSLQNSRRAICVSREHQKCFCIKLNDNKIIRMRGERKVDECGRLAKQHIFKLANENAKNDPPAVGDSRIAGRSHHTHTSTRWHLERPCQPKIVKTQTKWMRTLPSRGNSI